MPPTSDLARVQESVLATLRPTQSVNGREVVGYFYRKHVNGDCVSYQPCYTLYLTRTSKLILGRDPSCNWHTNDPEISAKHLEIHSVAVDEDVDPLVYVKDISRHGVSGTSRNLRHWRGSILLNDGDKLRLSSRITLMFKTYQRQLFSPPLFLAVDQFGNPRDAPLGDVPLEHFTAIKNAYGYELSDRLLGSGAEATVHPVWDPARGKQFACKVVRLQSREVPPHLAREVAIWRQMIHPNVIRFDRSHQIGKKFYIFQELAPGGDLYSYIVARGNQVGEPMAGFIIMQVLKAVEWMHDRNIVHRDIKPENIMLTSRDAAPRVVLSDFGDAYQGDEHYLGKNFEIIDRVGTVAYWAPEHYTTNRVIYTHNYAKPADMWAVGFVAKILLTGQPLSTWSKTIDDDLRRQGTVDEAVVAAELVTMWHDPAFLDNVSRLAKNFIYWLVQIDGCSRWPASEAVLHPWLAGKYDPIYEKAIDRWFEEAT